ncbi:DNA binding domain protein, excisionase family [Syntrophobotulus glycolicus DSM 8271]|uniref:DNA binding domain protein, excisionase family n=2 Tax=Syntrophobotulus TaxID=51196 RepID=F0SYL2_SYNGF|nr:DNA binding domain protein, excisionase family [Syntrophobotulus glycolicus DSM 8271]
MLCQDHFRVYINETNHNGKSKAENPLVEAVWFYILCETDYLFICLSVFYQFVSTTYSYILFGEILLINTNISMRLDANIGLQTHGRIVILRLIDINRLGNGKVMSENQSLTPQEIAGILKISKSTVYELIKRKELNSYRVGKKLRVDSLDVENYKNKTKEIKTVPLQSPPQPVSFPQPYLPAPAYPLLKSNSFVICGQDVVLDILCRYLDRHPKGVRALRSYEGSYNGLYQLYRGEVQVATAHLWDSKSGEYNVPFVERMLPGTPAVVIRLASRIQGFYILKDNPKRIKGWEDLRRPDISIVNREKGSGTRILLDEHLKSLGIYGNSIQGYSRECFSHLAVASAVARAGADLGLGNEKGCQQVQGIDFIPLQTEQYDLVLRKEDLSKPEFEAIIDILLSEEFKTELTWIGGYDLTELGKIIAET